jgi:predicted MFS family arabinose efflux permease
VRRLIFLVGAVIFVDTMFYAALTPLLPEYADEHDLSKAGAGLLAASYALGALAGGIPGGLAAARFGVKPTVLFGLAGMTLTTLTFGVAETIWLLDAARFLQGFASSFSWTAGIAWIVAATPPERRGVAIGSAMGAAVLGALFGPVLGGIATLTGTGAAFGSVAVLAAILGVWAYRTPAAAPGTPQPLRALFAALRDPLVVAAIWLVALPALLFGVLNVLAPLRLDELGVSALAIGATFLVAAGFEAVLNPLLGRFSDRWGRFLPIRVGLLGSAVAAATLPWIGRGWVLAMAIVLAAICFGAFWTPAMSMLADRADDLGLDYAYGFALINLAWAPGAAAGAALGGALARATGDALPYILLATACTATLAWVLRLTPAVSRT